jgi:hypothetical protein
MPRYSPSEKDRIKFSRLAFIAKGFAKREEKLFPVAFLSRRSNNQASV